MSFLQCQVYVDFTSLFLSYSQYASSYRALDSNDLQFSFSSIKYATNLTKFDLSDTGLFHLDGIQDAPSLSSLDISGNDFKEFPLEVLKITTLQVNALPCFGTLFIHSSSFIFIYLKCLPCAGAFYRSK